MELEFGDIVTLENEMEFIVGGKCEFRKSTYVYLVNKEDATDCMLCLLEKENLINITNDEESFMEIMPRILGNVNFDLLNEIILENKPEREEE